MSGLYATPTIALAPLFILWLGIGIWSKVLVVIFAGAVPGHDQHRGRTAHHQRAADRDAALVRRDASGRSSSRCRCRRRCRSSWPGSKLGIGRGLIGVVVAELFGSRAGLGRLISQSADAFNMPELFAGVIVLAVAGIVMTAGFSWLEKRLVPWTKD